MVTIPPPDLQGFHRLPRGQKILIIALVAVTIAATVLAPFLA